MIYEAYVKESKIIDKTDEEKSLDLVKSLIKTKYELDSACKNFEFCRGRTCGLLFIPNKSKSS